jgi:RNA polymerase sigma factor (TIGR02999 family)
MPQSRLTPRCWPAPSALVMLAFMSDVTRILSAIEQGDHHAAEQLLPLVYDELRRLAAAQMAREKLGQTLDATALVHEAYLRLVGDQHFDNRRHFFAAAAEAMCRILVEQARRKNRQKRGGGRKRIDLEDLAVAAPESDERLLALDEALQRLAAVEPQKAELVKLRSFAGLSLDAAADLLGISPSTADRWWAYARAWLRVEIEGEKPDSSWCDPSEKGA